VAGIKLKSADDLKLMRSACAVAGTVLDEIAAFIRPGLTTRQVDEFAAGCIRAHGAKSAFLGYRKYPCHTCLSVNDEVVHGLAGERELHFGDIVSVDVGVFYRGFVGDTARTVVVGGCGVLAQRLMDVTERALYEGIAAAVPGNRVTDISRASKLRRRQRVQRRAGICRPRRRAHDARRTAGAEFCGPEDERQAARGHDDCD
jgi:methionyl aminopeptidase